MAIPTANFTYLLDTLIVDFTDLSIDNPTSWSWDFGDGNFSSLQNPSHTYLVPGPYTVTLIATNLDGSSPIFQRSFEVGAPSYMSVSQFIECDLPAGLTITPECQSTHTMKWQLWLQTLIDPHIPTPDVHDDSKWPNLVNALIAKLVIYDAFNKAAQGALVLLWDQTSGSSGGETKGEEKAIKTGPTEVEWHSAASSIAALMKPGAGRQGESLFDAMRQQICDLSSRERIKLPMCPALAHSPVVPIKAAKPPRITTGDILRDYFNY